MDPAVPQPTVGEGQVQVALPLPAQGPDDKSAPTTPTSLDKLTALPTTTAAHSRRFDLPLPPSKEPVGSSKMADGPRKMPVPLGTKVVANSARALSKPASPKSDSPGIQKQISGPLAMERQTTPSVPVQSVAFQVSDKTAPNNAPADSLEQNGSRDETRVNEVFEETDIREAIRVLASLAGQSVVIDDTVGGFTSATIENETFENALRKITLPLGLVVGKYRGQYLVGTSDPGSNLFPFLSVTYRYEPQHRSSKSLTELLPERLRPFIHIGENWNIIVVDGPEVIGQEIVNRLRDLDQPVPQVLLEAIICVVSPDSGFRFGIDWNHSLGRDTSKALELGVKNLSFTGLANQAGIKDAFQDFAITSAFVQALADQGYITIRATPRVFAKDGEKAEIIIGRETFFSLQPTNTSSLLFRPDVQKVIAGITLTIIPHIRGENVSVLIEKAEVSEDIRTSTAQLSANPYPIINRRTVTTTVHVRDGHTIAIGGLVQRQTVDRTSKIPILGDAPLIGKLFQTMESQEQDVEIAIFISPRIVKPCADSLSDCNIMISPQVHETQK